MVQFISAKSTVSPLTLMAEKAEPQNRPTIEALAQLYETHYERVVRYISVRVGNASMAEDMASEVFVKAVEAFDSFQWREIPLEAWIYRIAHNYIIDFYRKNSKHKDVPLEVATARLGLSTHEQVELKLEIKDLAQALNSLTPQQREIIAMRFGSGMDSQSIAQVMGKKSGAVRELQSSAIKKLRSVMEKPPREPKVKSSKGMRQEV